MPKCIDGLLFHPVTPQRNSGIKLSHNTGIDLHPGIGFGLFPQAEMLNAVSLYASYSVSTRITEDYFYQADEKNMRVGVNYVLGK